MVGIITYHSAYNFGSALQAYATQCAVEKIGHEACILNYRMTEQDRFYRALYRRYFGVSVLLKDLILLPLHKKRKARAERFEVFFEKRYHLSPEVKEPEQVATLWQAYNTVVSGSDQIWNKHSWELANNDWCYMAPYLLSGFIGHKVSYASSTGNMTSEELQRILPDLQQFGHLSFREEASASTMATLLGCPVETVLDPTFLLTKDEWVARLSLKREEKKKYILAYSLGGLKQLFSLLPALSKLAKSRNCLVKLVMPFAYLPYPDRRIEYHPEYGPVEFLNALYNAEVVVTDSYHGTILSVNFGKDFYSVCKSGGAEFRKTDILERLGLHERIVMDATMIPDLNLSPIDYATVYDKLDALRQHSINYLKTALKG